MNELTGLEICVRIAEIEGITYHFEIGDTNDCYIYSEQLNKEFNPIAKTETGKALCFDLMVKHDIKLSRNRSGEFVAMNNQYLIKVTQDPQVAICLAIIETPKEQ